MDRVLSRKVPAAIVDYYSKRDPKFKEKMSLKISQLTKDGDTVVVDLESPLFRLPALLDQIDRYDGKRKSYVSSVITMSTGDS